MTDGALLLVYFIIGILSAVGMVRHESKKRQLGHPALMAIMSPLVIVMWPVYLVMVAVYTLGTVGYKTSVGTNLPTRQSITEAKLLYHVSPRPYGHGND